MTREQMRALRNALTRMERPLEQAELSRDDAEREFMHHELRRELAKAWAAIGEPDHFQPGDTMWCFQRPPPLQLPIAEAQASIEDEEVLEHELRFARLDS